MNELGIAQERWKISCDNQGALQLAKNDIHHERTKQIDVKLHFIIDKVASGEVELH